ncbi:MAG: peptide-methionine (S)-S-oxide reductase MsrA [Kiritimatiellae bacterium]|nr:peptide-methionine (S)-S-oxide reductase MsrA [Kiritimatiellia bacterium]
MSPKEAKVSKPSRTEVATFAGGCFWCIEAVFEQVPGVLRAESGYIGGHVENPTYEEVCTGETGHAEAVQIEFDPSIVTYEDLLDWFWRAHDPTQLNRQGPDVGTQYRSAIFYHNEAQREAALESIARLNASGKFSRPIVTQVVPATVFYRAEEYHQDYYVNHRRAGYCQFVIRPKLEKLGLKP